MARAAATSIVSVKVRRPRGSSRSLA